MHWIIQSDLHREEGMADLLKTLERFSIPHNIVDVPRTLQAGDIADMDGLVFPVGAYRLLWIAKEKGWKPGALLGEAHGQQACAAAYGELLLNHGARLSRFSEMEPVEDTMFVRPAHDNKMFDGQVLSRAAILEWRDAVISGKPSPVRCSPRLDGDFSVLLAPVRTVMRESRHFVVDGDVVTSSTYKVAGIPACEEWVDPAEVDFARSMARHWGPDRAYVLDVALTPAGHRVVETNCINSAGFYAADVQRLVMALESVEWNPSTTSA